MLMSVIILAMTMWGCSPASEIEETEIPQETEETQGTDEGTDDPQVIKGSFAIQNVQTGKNIRPYNSGTSNGNRIVLYDHNEWKCLTYEFIHVEDDIYQLKNLYTQKTFEPSSTLQSGVTLWQQPLKDIDLHRWEFIEQSENRYLIRLKGTDFYVAISSDKTDSNIILMPKQDSDSQVWRLIEQYPKV